MAPWGRNHNQLYTPEIQLRGRGRWFPPASVEEDKCWTPSTPKGREVTEGLQQAGDCTCRCSGEAPCAQEGGGRRRFLLWSAHSVPEPAVVPNTAAEEPRAGEPAALQCVCWNNQPACLHQRLPDDKELSLQLLLSSPPHQQLAPQETAR